MIFSCVYCIPTTYLISAFIRFSLGSLPPTSLFPWVCSWSITNWQYYLSSTCTTQWFAISIHHKTITICLGFDSPLKGTKASWRNDGFQGWDMQSPRWGLPSRQHLKEDVDTSRDTEASLNEISQAKPGTMWALTEKLRGYRTLISFQSIPQETLLNDKGENTV